MDSCLPAVRLSDLLAVMAFFPRFHLSFACTVALFGSNPNGLLGQNRLLPLPDAKTAQPSTPAQAVAAGKKWLRGTQKTDGSWGEKYRCGITGLALQALLDGGVPDGSIANAATCLLKEGEIHNWFISGNLGITTHCVYENAIALEALIAYGKAGGTEPRLKLGIEQCGEIIIRAQQASGSWGYGASSPAYVKDREDLSVTWWTYHALKSLASTQIRVDGLPEALRRAEAYVVSKRQPEGGIGQNSRRDGAYGIYTLTGPGLSVLLRARPADTKALGVAHWLLHEYQKDPPDWRKNANLYSWYGTTMALRYSNPTTWNAWKLMVAPQLLQFQKADGSWSQEVGSFAAATSAAAGADAEIYRTCLCLLMLETMGADKK